jgi:hypothetical protein
MSDQALSTYLDDHLAGSVGAIEMVERAIEENAGTLLGRRLEEVLKEIRKDQAVVQDLIERLGSKENPLKKAGARLEVLETLTMGIHGKRALWRALRVVANKHPVLRGIDLDLLERRAVEQHDRVEEWRLEAAREVL